MKEIPLTQGKFAVVDDADFESLNQWKWCAMRARNKWYAVRKIGKAPLRLMHQELLGFPGTQIDHEDGDGLNNQRKNIRKATPSQNGANRGRQRDNTSGFKGVYYSRANDIWVANIKIHGKTRNLGSFQDIREAARAYDTAARNFFGKFAACNFPAPVRQTTPASA